MKDNDRKFEKSEMRDNELKNISQASDGFEAADDTEMQDDPDFLDDSELFGDLGFDLKSSLDTAFDMSGISVTEDLIASTLAKINTLKEDDGQEPDSVQIADNVQKTGNIVNVDNAQKPDNIVNEDNSQMNGVVSLTERRKKLRGFFKIAGPIAAALIIGIFGFSVIKNSLLGKKSADSASNYAPASESAMNKNSEMLAGNVKSDDYEKSVQYFSNENMAVTEADGAAAMLAADAYDPEAMLEDDMDGVSSGENFDTSSNYGDITQSTGSGTVKEASDGSLKEQRGEAGKQKSFAVPEELSGEIVEIIGRYCAASVCAGDYLAGAYKHGNSINDTGSNDKKGLSLDAGSVNIAKYLVVTNDVIYFTDDETMVPEEDSMVYLIEDPYSGRDSLISEIEELLK
ncbi:MAG: hypothetical protein J5824_01610 [Lachnospiraceae bacterium]|nr:hypothetical protein [Lachnospiraceae bacterium]